MTREEAIKVLKVEYLGEWEKVREAKDIAIKALEQEPCEDCISRREAIKMFTYNYKGERIPDYDCDNFPVQIAMKTVKEMLRELPSVNPQPKMGRWINGDDKCPCCGKSKFEGLDADIYADWQPKYCPNCGTKMGVKE